MAHESEKKRAKAAAATKQLYTNITIAIYIVWFVTRVLWQWESFGFSSFLGILFLSAVNYFCMSSVIRAAEYGTPYETWQDVLFVNWFVMLMSLVWSRAWIIWLVIPGYAIYQYGPWLARMMGFGSPAAAEPETVKRSTKKQPTQAAR